MILWYFNHKPGGLIWAIFFTVRNTNLDGRTAVADLLAIANIGPSGRRIVQCNENTLNTPYEAGLTNGKSGTAYINMSSVDYGTILYIVSGTNRIFLRSKDNGIWSNWGELLKKADYEAKKITNSYGLTIVLFTFGSDTIKAIKIGGYVNKALSAGTAYTIATNTEVKSRVEWYHNIHCGINGINTVAYLRITTDGNIVLTPQTAIASGVGINIAEYYV